MFGIKTVNYLPEEILKIPLLLVITMHLMQTANENRDT